MAHGSDKSFEQRWKEDLRNAKAKTPSSAFAQLYPSKKPTNAEKGGWDGVFASDLRMHIGLGIDTAGGENACLIRREDGIFVWSERTMRKLEESNSPGTLETKQIKLICGTFELAYRLMMGKDAIDNGVPFRHFLGPARSS